MSNRDPKMDREVIERFERAFGDLIPHEHTPGEMRAEVARLAAENEALRENAVCTAELLKFTAARRSEAESALAAERGKRAVEAEAFANSLAAERARVKVLENFGASVRMLAAMQALRQERGKAPSRTWGDVLDLCKRNGFEGSILREAPPASPSDDTQAAGTRAGTASEDTPRVVAPERVGTGFYLRFIVNGEDACTVMAPHQPFASAREVVLRELGHTGRPADEWDVITEKGHRLNPASTPQDHAMPTGTRLLLSLRIGIGGALAHGKEAGRGE